MQRCFSGARTKALSCDTSNPVNPARTPLSNGSTEPIGKRSWMPICLKTWIRFEKSPTNGSRSITRNAPMGHWKSCHPDCSGNRQKTLHLHSLLDGGDYNLHETQKNYVIGSIQPIDHSQTELFLQSLETLSSQLAAKNSFHRCFLPYIRFSSKLRNQPQQVSSH